MKNTVKPVTRKAVPKAAPKVEKQREFFSEGYDDELRIEDEEGDEIIGAGTETIPYCCGVDELGEIWMEERSLTAAEEKSPKFTNVLDNALISMMAARTKNGKKSTCRTVICNLIVNRQCNILRAAFLRTGLFSLVKTFNNSGTGRQIEMWVSTN